ncbi:D-2-hydroxyacid dehydrogenase [Pseudomonas sp. B21-031]|uniref:D-2-hydroxyacid dehydrogenase n=1 Tax=Pseudomonas sp. B21-031 TaxID=2895482 RepID=UPI00215F9F32|nr:D-2-hydroxyacid dehydrogenase [Pseudomonas sp. B21-031]UVL65141.1 D-2-hydroxyacid dehydrogenase [Pseudomonas sp. B21-031]
MKVVFLDSDSLPTPFPRPEEATSWLERPSTMASEVVSALAGADVAITNKVAIRREHLEQLPDLKLICVAATGYDCIDIAACRDRGVVVCNVPAYSTRSVSEAVIGSMFALRRHLTSYLVAAREWPASSHFCVHKQPIKDVEGSVMGIVGRGAIGTATARLAQALGMTVIYAEHAHAREVREGYVAFDEVLAHADVVSLHCPLTPQTAKLIGPSQLRRMKRGALLINTARGALIDEQALFEALSCGTLGGAALDVLDGEPPRADHPLLKIQHPNLLITPHVAWASTSSIQNLCTVITCNIRDYANGQARNVVS